MWGMKREMGFVEKVKGFLLSPAETFRAVRPETLGDGLKYALIFLAIFGVLLGTVFAVIWTVLAGIIGAFVSIPAWITGLGLLIALLILALILVFGIVGFLVGGAWQHLWVYVCGGREGYTQTVKALVYGATPSFVLGWIPFLGFIGIIWAIVVTIIGLRELHEISTGRAVAAWLLSVVMIWVILWVIMSMLLAVI